MAEQQAEAPDRWARVGGVVFIAGLAAVLVTVLPFFFGVRNWPLAVNLAAGLLPPAGVGIALWGLVRGARKARAQRPQPVGIDNQPRWASEHIAINSIGQNRPYPLLRDQVVSDDDTT